MHARAPISKRQEAARSGVWLRVLRTSVVAAASLATVLAHAESDVDLPLPRWTPELARPAGQPDAGRQFNQLLPPESNLLPPPPEVQGLLETGPRLSDGPPALMEDHGKLEPQDLTLFLHGSILNQAGDLPAPAKPTPAVSLRDLPPELLSNLYDAPAGDYLLDPQTLVPEVPRQDLDRLLEFHAKDARITLFLLVLDGDQKLPQTAALERIAAGALTKHDTCLAIFPLGEPWRARFMVSQSVHQYVATRSLTDLAEDCIKDAQQASDPVQQLHRFSVRLSTRLFWLEKSLPAEPGRPSTAGARLQEVAQGGGAAAGGLTKSAANAEAAAVAASVSLTTLFIIGGLFASGLWFVRSRRRHLQLSRVWLLPEQEVSPRLGGAFSGGAGAVVHYGAQGSR